MTYPSCFSATSVHISSFGNFRLTFSSSCSSDDRTDSGPEVDAGSVRRVTVSPRKVEGLGPTTREGIPSALRSVSGPSLTTNHQARSGHVAHSAPRHGVRATSAVRCKASKLSVPSLFCARLSQDDDDDEVRLETCVTFNILCLLRW